VSSDHSRAADESGSMPPTSNKPRAMQTRLKGKNPFVYIGLRLGRRVHFLRNMRVRVGVGLIALLIVGFEVVTILQPYLIEHTYALGSAGSLLPHTSAMMEKKITFDAKNNAFNFNQGYTPDVSGALTLGGPQITAVAYVDPSKGLIVTDPANHVSFTIKPTFSLLQGKRNGNHIIYPLSDGTGWLVYTMQGFQVKEDVVLRHANGDKMVMSYDLDLGDSFAARLQPDGSMGIFGSSLPINGNVSTGSAKDAELLQKARQNAVKNKLFFSLPAPLVKEYDRAKSNVNVKYKLQDQKVKVLVSGLKRANYPLTIDPSVYVESTAKFMRGNNESNIDFDPSGTNYGFIRKGVLTGARLTSAGWTSSLALTAARWGQATVAGGGYIYTIGGSSGSSNVKNVYWAQLPLTSSAITAADPGAGACTNWCTNSVYDLVAARQGLSGVVYNGYLYAIGGKDSSCATTNNACNTVYYAKLGANGEPLAWTATSSLVTARFFAGAVVYNNRIYVAGGQTTASLNGDQTIESATLNPDGSLSAWSTTGMTSIPTAGRWGHTLLQYNGYLYLVGGSSTTTAAATVQYIKVNSDGTLASSWLSANAFTNARMAFGGNFATIYGGYMYIASGCATLTTTSCSTFTSTTNDFQYASINGDGSLDSWTSLSTSVMSAGSTAMTGYGLVAWREALYGIGGCTAVSSATNCSGTTQTLAQYGAISSDGDIGPISTGGALPPDGSGNGQGGTLDSAVGINNGYIYNVGGCMTLSSGACSAASSNIGYANLNSNGTISAPTCNNPNHLANSLWCVDSTNTLTTGGNAGIAGAMVTVYNNRMFVFGGTNATTWQSTFFSNTFNADGSLSGGWVSVVSSSAFKSGQVPAGRGYGYMFGRAVSGTGGTANLYIVGGCSGTTGLACTTFYNDVYKCTLTTAGAINTTVGSQCTTDNQLQIQDLDAATAGSQGLGVFGGANWGDYIYLTGGACGGTNSGSTSTACDGATNSSANTAELKQIYVAKLDSSNNIVAAGINGNNNWQIASNQLGEQRVRHFAQAINGYLYVFGGYDGTSGSTATLNNIELAKIDPTTGDVNAFSTLATTFTARWGLSGVMADNIVYVLGGCTAGNAAASCTSISAGTDESFQINNNDGGSPASFNTATNNVGTDYTGGRSVVYNGILYYVGGCTNIGCTTFTNVVNYTPISADGNLGTAWSTTSAMGTNRAFFGLVAYGGYMYAIGGQNATNTALATTEHAQINSNGTLNAWAADTSMGAGNERADFGYAYYNGYVYIVGGTNNSAALQTSVFYAQIGSPGLTWTTTGVNAIATARSGLMVMAYGGSLFAMGGFDGTNYLADVQYTPIASDHTISTWTATTSMPQGVRQGTIYAANGYV